MNRVQVLYSQTQRPLSPKKNPSGESKTVLFKVADNPQTQKAAKSIQTAFKQYKTRMFSNSSDVLRAQLSKHGQQVNNLADLKPNDVIVVAREVFGETDRGNASSHAYIMIVKSVKPTMVFDVLEMDSANGNIGARSSWHEEAEEAARQKALQNGEKTLHGLRLKYKPLNDHGISLNFCVHENRPIDKINGLSRDIANNNVFKLNVTPEQIRFGYEAEQHILSEQTQMLSKADPKNKIPQYGIYNCSNAISGAVTKALVKSLNDKHLKTRKLQSKL